LHNYAFDDDKFLLNSLVDFWKQPKNLEFKDKEGQFGFGLKSQFAIRLSSWNDNTKAAYFNIGASYKTNGFLPEAPSLREDFRVHLGMVLSIKE
jgi:hypothetical protein